MRFKKRRGEVWLPLVVALAVPQVIGGLGSLATSRSISTWYRWLRKPSWNPPAAVFPFVWTSLYLMMGAASWLVWKRGRLKPAETPQVQEALGLYGIQLIFNLLWSVIFFGLRRIGLAFAELLGLWVLILATLKRFYEVDRMAGALLLPYQLWTTFAGALNAAIWWLNRQEEQRTF